MPKEMLPLQSNRSQSLSTSMKERTGNSLQARRVCPEPAWDGSQVMREAAVWTPTIALKIIAACSLTCWMPPDAWNSNNNHKFYIQQKPHSLFLSIRFSLNNIQYQWPHIKSPSVKLHPFRSFLNLVFKFSVPQMGILLQWIC